jgi:GNAT superfamily N-acetyltransferase
MPFGLKLDACAIRAGSCASYCGLDTKESELLNSSLMRTKNVCHTLDPLEARSMTTIAFRRARPDDLSSIIALLADDVLGQQREDASSPPNQDYVDAFSAILADPNQLQMVATSNDEIIGTLQLTFIPGLARKGAWRGQIEAVRIAAAQRGSGVGQQMFEWAIDQCKARGCHLVQLTTDKTRSDAHRFYDRLGFTDSHIGYKLML